MLTAVFIAFDNVFKEPARVFWVISKAFSRSGVGYPLL